MRYFYNKPEITSMLNYGVTYTCDHPVYDKCTLYLINNKGLAVIQQQLHTHKATIWGPIDSYLVDQLYLHEKFLEYFKSKANIAINGLYPTVTLRQIMWALRMKPLKREPWETVFDKCPI